MSIYREPRPDGLIYIFATDKVDHLSRTDGPWAPICGRRIKGHWMLADLVDEGVHTCYRCEALSGEVTA